MDSSAAPLQPALPLHLGLGPAEGLLSVPHLSMAEATRRLMDTRRGHDRARSVLAYRETLALLGFKQGFQWLLAPEGPGRAATIPEHATDVDVVTFCRRPLSVTTDSAWRAFVDMNQPLLDPNRVWAGFGCRAYFVDLGLPPEAVIAQALMWFDVLIRQRAALGLELLQVPLGDVDDAAAARMVTWS